MLVLVQRWQSPKTQYVPDRVLLPKFQISSKLLVIPESIKLDSPMHRFHQLLSPYFLKMLVELFDDIFNCHISEDDLKPTEYFLLKLLEESVIFVNLINFLAVKLPFYHIELLAGFFLILN